MPLVSDPEIKEYIQISHAAQDLVIPLMRDAAAELVQRETGLIFEEKVGIIDVLTGGGYFLTMFQRPVTNVSEILDLFINDVVDDDLWMVNKNRIQLGGPEGISNLIVNESTGSLKFRWGEGHDRYQVTYDAGHAEENVPAALKLAVLDMLKRFYDVRGGVKQQSAAGFGRSWETFDKSDFMRLLHPYRDGASMV